MNYKPFEPAYHADAGNEGTHKHERRRFTNRTQCFESKLLFDGLQAFSQFVVWRSNGACLLDPSLRRWPARRGANNASSANGSSNDRRLIA